MAGAFADPTGAVADDKPALLGRHLVLPHVGNLLAVLLHVINKTFATKPYPFGV